MPVLHKRKKSKKDDSGCYVLAHLPGGSAIITWQITPDGIEALRLHGYKGEDTFKFAPSLLKELIEHRQAYTFGSGVKWNPPTISVSRAEPPAIRASRSEAASLIIFQRAGSWELAIQIDEIPHSWGSAAESLVNALSGWKLVAEAGVAAPATQLWPGRGGAHLPVRPHTEPYIVQPVGSWPESWNVSGWLGIVPGLSHLATLFSGEGGERLEPGLALEPGESYFLVAPADTSSGRGRWPPPSFLDPESLGDHHGWQAWTIQVPRSADIRLSAWCDAVGYRLAQTRYRFSLITPLHGYSEQGVPVVLAERDIVFGLSPAGDGAEADAETSFYAMRFQEPGMYRVALDDISTVPLYVVVEYRVAAQPENPAALAIDLGLCGEQITLQALKDGVGPHTIQMPQTQLREPPIITVHCAVPLDIIWELGATKGRIEQASAEEAGARVSEQVAEAVRHRESLKIQLDAGAYGRLQLECAAYPSTGVNSPPLHPAALRRARWLSAVLRGGQHTGMLIPLPRSIRRKLANLSTLPGCAALRDLRAVPALLIPHLRAITKLLQD